jgi:hypothetical protein
MGQLKNRCAAKGQVNADVADEVMEAVTSTPWEFFETLMTLIQGL